MPHKERPGESETDYNIVTFVDVNNSLPFAKKEFTKLEEKLKEEIRVEKDIKHFMAGLSFGAKLKTKYIGSENRFGKHVIRFLLKDGGLIEFIVEKPFTINGHFITKKSAEIFAAGLKSSFQKIIPDSPVKSMILSSISVENSKQAEFVTFEKHSLMHHIRIRKTVIMSIVAIQLFLLFEIVQEIFMHITLEYIKIPSIVVSLVASVIIALLFEPIKELVSEVFQHFFDE